MRKEKIYPKTFPLPTSYKIQNFEKSCLCCDKCFVHDKSSFYCIPTQNERGYFNAVDKNGICDEWVKLTKYGLEERLGYYSENSMYLKPKEYDLENT